MGRANALCSPGCHGYVYTVYYRLVCKPFLLGIKSSLVICFCVGKVLTCLRLLRVDMKLSEDQRKLQTLLKETITLVCKSRLQSSKGFVIDALIGITTDDASTFLLKLEETVGDVDVEDNAESEKSDHDEAGRGGSRSSRKRPPDGDTRRTDSKRHRSDDDDFDNASDDDYKDNDDQDCCQDAVTNKDTQLTDYDVKNVDSNYGNDMEKEIENEADSDLMCAKPEQSDQVVNEGDDNLMCVKQEQSDKVENEGDSDLICVKQEQSDDDHKEKFILVDQFTLADLSQDGDATSPSDTAPDDTAADDTTPDDTAPDGSSFDDETQDDSSTPSQSSATNDPNASGSQQVCFLRPDINIDLFIDRFFF